MVLNRNSSLVYCCYGARDRKVIESSP